MLLFSINPVCFFCFIFFLFFFLKVVAQANFAFFDPKPDDFHGVKILLQTYLDNKLWDLSGFVDLILGQTTVGTVVKIEGDEDDGVFSLITALNLGRYKAMHFNSQLLMTAYLLVWLLYIVVLTSDLSALIPGIASLLAITLFYSRVGEMLTSFH